jgi:hypothetical protein
VEQLGADVGALIARLSVAVRNGDDGAARSAADELRALIWRKFPLPEPVSVDGQWRAERWVDGQWCFVASGTKTSVMSIFANLLEARPIARVIDPNGQVVKKYEAQD